MVKQLTREVDIMEKLVEKLISLKNGYMERFAKKHKYMAKGIWKFAGEKDYGLQILDEDGAVKEEYTLHTDKMKITGYDIGIGKAKLTSRVKESVLEEMITKAEGYEKHPHLYTFKMMPDVMKHVFKGDLRYGKKK
jgi:hypothetical protein